MKTTPQSVTFWLLPFCLTSILNAQPCAAADVGKNVVLVGSEPKVESADWKCDPKELHSPFGIDFDADGNGWIVELEGARLHRLSADGTLQHIAGKLATNEPDRRDVKVVQKAEPAAGVIFNGPHNVAVTKSGNVYVADSWNNAVRIVDPKRLTIRTVVGTHRKGFGGNGGPASTATFDQLMCVALNPSETALLVADLKNRRIRKIDLKTNRVTTIAGNGKKGVPTDGDKATTSPLIDPRAVAEDVHGNVYILERGGHALRVVRADGTIETVAGTGKSGYSDGPALTAKLNSPKHLTVDPVGNVYIADDPNRVIRKYDPVTKTLTTVLGHGIGNPARYLSRPHGVCFHDGHLYVCDTGHHRIIRVEPAAD